MKHRHFSWDIQWYICVLPDIPRKVSVFHFNLNWKDQEGVLLFEVRLFQHGVLFSFAGWLVVIKDGDRGWWTWAEVISQLRLIGPGCWLGAKHGGNQRFSFLP